MELGRLYSMLIEKASIVESLVGFEEWTHHDGCSQE
jgi:hypothetical protein